MDTYSARFLSRPVAERLQQTERRLQLWLLQQQGSVAEFNRAFDSLSANLDVPEDYLVEAYVFGLKEEVAESVKLFNPLTICAARSLARVQEISLQWRAKKVEQARKELKDQEKGLATKESKGSCLFNTQECIVNQEASVEAEPEKQETAVAQETNDDDHEVECVTMQEPRELPSTIAGGVAEKIQEATSFEIICGARTEPTGSVATERTREATTSLSDMELSKPTFSQVPPKDKNVNTADEVYGSLNLASVEKFLGKLHETSSCLTPSLSPLPLSSSTVIVWSLSLSHLPLSLAVSAISKAIASVCIVPLGSFPSLLSLFQSLGLRSSQSINYALALGNRHQSMWQGQKVTWLNKVELEESKIQLDTTLFNLQKVDGLQLDDTPFQQQQILHNTMGLALLDGFMGWDFGKEGPSFLLLWILPIKPTSSFCHWVVFAARCLVLSWFKGELISMLYGRLCSLSKKEKGKAKARFTARSSHQEFSTV